MVLVYLYDASKIISGQNKSTFESMESSETNYSLFFPQFGACLSISNGLDNSYLNRDFLLYSTLNQNHDMSPIIPLQTPTENLVSSNNLNSFEPEQPFLQNSATELNASSKTVKHLPIPTENLAISKILNNFESQQHMLLNSSTDTTYHFSTPSQLLPNNVTENLGGPNSSKNVSSDQLLDKPIEFENDNPQENGPPSQTASDSGEIFDKIFHEKDDYSLSYVFQEGLKYCAMFNKTDENTSNITIEDKPLSGLLLAKSTSKAPIKQDQDSLKMHDLFGQEPAKSPPKLIKQNGQKSNLTKGKLQVRSSNIPGHKVASKKPTLSPLLASLIKRTNQNLSGSLLSPIPSSNSPPTITRGTSGGPIRSRSRELPVKLFGELTNAGFDWNMKYRDRSSGSGTFLYHGASRLSRSNSACDYNRWETLPSRINLETETSKWQSNLHEGSNWTGIGDQEFSSSFYDQSNKSFQTSTTLSPGTQTRMQTSSQETNNHVPLNATQIVAKIVSSTNQFGSFQNQPPERLQILPAPAHQSPQKLDFTSQVSNQNSTSLSFSQDCNTIPILSRVNASNFHVGHKNSHGSSKSFNEVVPKPYSGGFQTFTVGARVDLGTKIDTQTSNLASLKVGEKELENMVNWPEHQLMGTDRFGFDI